MMCLSRADVHIFSLAPGWRRGHDGLCWYVYMSNGSKDLHHFFSILGKEATDAFEDVGHSQDAREMLDEYEIGVLPEADLAKLKTSEVSRSVPHSTTC